MLYPRLATTAAFVIVATVAAAAAFRLLGLPRWHAALYPEFLYIYARVWYISTLELLSPCGENFNPGSKFLV